MEGMSASMYRGLKGCWRRRGYSRLTGAGRRRMNQVELGRAGSNRRRRFWRIRIAPKLRLISPKKLLIRLRDAYVNFMLRIANSRVAGAGGFGGAVGGSFAGFGRGPLKEYDEKMLVEIYKSLMVAQGNLLPRDAPARIPTNQIVCRQ